MSFAFHDETKPRLLVMVSKFGHCLNDLIFRWRAGTLGGDIALVVSNHPDLRPMAEAAGLPFVHLPVTPDTKADAEARLLRAGRRAPTSTWWCWPATCRSSPTISAAHCEGRAINIHHSFLPGFKGAKPYHQAYARGVKLVGATAHYVTAELDEGPIIEQEVIRVDHTYHPTDPVHGGPGRRVPGPVPRRPLALREPDPAPRPQHRRLPLTRTDHTQGCIPWHLQTPHRPARRHHRRRHRRHQPRRRARRPRLDRHHRRRAGSTRPARRLDLPRTGAGLPDQPVEVDDPVRQVHRREAADPGDRTDRAASTRSADSRSPPRRSGSRS